MFRRFLRSAGLRYQLWKAAGGRCQSCGIELPDDWHADHVIPFSVTGTTQIQNMQALCPTCNLKKGTRIMNPDPLPPLRPFQESLQNHVRELMARPDYPRIFLLNASPGSGKGDCPELIANLCIPEYADNIFICVPNIALAEQTADLSEKTIDPATGTIVEKCPWNVKGHRFRISLKPEGRLDKTFAGVIKTRAGLENDTKGHITDWFKEPILDPGTGRLRHRRVIFFVDENHHIVKGSPAALKLDEIMALGPEIVRMLVLMTGTLYRHDRLPIWGLHYRRTDDGVQVDTNHPSQVYITYTNRQAQIDHVTIPLVFQRFDGSLRILKNGELKTIPSIRECDDSQDAILALDTDYAKEIMFSIGDNYFDTRLKQYSSAKFLVVAYNIDEANKMLRACKERWPQFQSRIGIAVSTDENDERSAFGKENIRRFKLPNDDPNAFWCLVTVHMVSEGVNVPQIDHIACLTRYRSYAYIIQLALRGGRVDPDLPWYAQRCLIGVPTDPKMDRIVDRILNDHPYVNVIPAAEYDQADARGELWGDWQPQEPGLPPQLPGAPAPQEPGLPPQLPGAPAPQEPGLPPQLPGDLAPRYPGPIPPPEPGPQITRTAIDGYVTSSTLDIAIEGQREGFTHEQRVWATSRIKPHMNIRPEELLQFVLEANPNAVFSVPAAPPRHFAPLTTNTEETIYKRHLIKEIDRIALQYFSAEIRSKAGQQMVYSRLNAEANLGFKRRDDMNAQDCEQARRRLQQTYPPRPAERNQ